MHERTAELDLHASPSPADVLLLGVLVLIVGSTGSAAPSSA
jgi:hypothetical protein